MIDALNVSIVTDVNEHPNKLPIYHTELLPSSSTKDA
jgi:hypothetical protein